MSRARALSVRSDRVSRRFVAWYGAEIARKRAKVLRDRLPRLAARGVDPTWLASYTNDLKRRALGAAYGLTT